MIKQVIIGLILLINCCFAQTISDTSKTTHRSYIGLGLYVPNQNLSIIGLHPSFEFASGFNFKKTNVIIVYNFKFLKSKNYYDYSNSDTTFSTKRFFCLAPRVEIDRKLFNKNKFILDLQIGFGLDFINPKFLSKKNIEYFYSYNLNIGFGGIFDLSTNSSFEPFIKYNFVDYSKSNLTGLNGGYLETGLRYYFMK